MKDRQRIFYGFGSISGPELLGSRSLAFACFDAFVSKSLLSILESKSGALGLLEDSFRNESIANNIFAYFGLVVIWGSFLGWFPEASGTFFGFLLFLEQACKVIRCQRKAYSWIRLGVGKICWLQ